MESPIYVPYRNWTIIFLSLYSHVMLLLGFVFTNVVLNQNQLDSPGLQIPFKYLAMWADELFLKIFSNAMEFNIDEANMYGFKFRSLQYEFLKHNYMFRLNYECRIIVNQLWWRNLQKKYNGPPLGSVVMNMTESKKNSITKKNITQSLVCILEVYYEVKIQIWWIVSWLFHWLNIKWI